MHITTKRLGFDHLRHGPVEFVGPSTVARIVVARYITATNIVFVCTTNGYGPKHNYDPNLILPIRSATPSLYCGSAKSMNQGKT